MYILDTDTFTHLKKGNQKVKKRLNSVPDFEFGITIVTKAELLRGRIDYLLKAEDATKLELAQKYYIETEKQIEQIFIVKFDLKALEIFEDFRQNSKFRKIGRNDTLIASICLAKRATLVTRNVKHFGQFPNLEVENWAD